MALITYYRRRGFEKVKSSIGFLAIHLRILFLTGSKGFKCHINDSVIFYKSEQNMELTKTVEEKPFLLTLLTVALGFIGIALAVIGLTAIIASPQSGIPLAEETYARFSNLSSASGILDIQTGSAMFLGGIIVLIVGSGLHQMRMWALQTIMVLLLISITFCSLYALVYIGTLDLFDVGAFEDFNGLILPVLCYCAFFFIYMITVRHYFD